MRHVVWDWNGTLYDDLSVIVESVNDSLAILGVAPIDADIYRDHYDRPVERFYTGLLGREVSSLEMDRVNAAFFAGYHRRSGAGKLTFDAAAALDRVAGAGATQSVLSMARQVDLLSMTAALEIDRYMALVQGVTGTAGGRKAGLLIDHLGRLAASIGELDHDDVVLIGDSLDDANAAQAAGVGAVLYDGGSHHRSDLGDAGVPVAGTLLEAVEIASSIGPP